MEKLGKENVDNESGISNLEKKLIDTIGFCQIVESLLHDRLFISKPTVISIVLGGTPAEMINIYGTIIDNDEPTRELKSRIGNHLGWKAVIEQRDWEDIFSRIEINSPIRMAVILACIRGCTNISDLMDLNNEYLWEVTGADVDTLMKQKASQLIDRTVPITTIRNNCDQETPLARALEAISA